MEKIQLLVYYEEERLVWGRRENFTRRYITFDVGSRFALWRTEEENGAVRFVAEPSPFNPCTVEDFVVRKGETVNFTCSQRYECAEDVIEEITTGTAQIIS